MKSFIDLFSDARAVSTPFIAVKTFDPSSTVRSVRKSLTTEPPIASYDSIHGLKGLNTEGSTELAKMAALAEIEIEASVDLPVALGIIEHANEDVIIFLHNPQLCWNSDNRVIQGIWNLRDPFKMSGNLLVMLIGAGDILPTELQQDVLVLDEPLPTREKLAAIVEDTFKDAAKVEKYAACKDACTPEVLKSACDALIGLPAFPAEQATAMCLDNLTGTLDVEMLWARKRSIVSQLPGLVFHQGKETLADMYGCESFKNFATSFMKGKHAPTVVLRTDEIEKQFAGNGTDSSGSTGKLLGEFLSWIEDNKVVCTLLLGVPGSSKSWSTYCIAGEFRKPLIKFDIAACEDKHVGEGGKNLRNAERTVDAISGGKVWLIATANSLRGLPPELISRFQVGGIFFFDAPDAEEREGILKLKIVKYNLDPNQVMPDTTSWSGRDLDGCARKSDLLGISLVEAGRFVVPLMTSHHEEMDALRRSASGRFLSASKAGVYEYTEPPKRIITPTVLTGRKIR